MVYVTFDSELESFEYCVNKGVKITLLAFIFNRSGGRLLFIAYICVLVALDLWVNLAPVTDRYGRLVGDFCQFDIIL